MNSVKNNDYEKIILNTIADSPSGLTITDLSFKTNIHRNTVSKYLGKLEGKGLVIKKRIGAARLYFSKEREFLRKDLVNSFMQALLFSLKCEFPNNKEHFKQIGHKILDLFQFPISEPYIEAYREARKITDPRLQLKLFKEFYNSYDFFQDELDISIQELTKKKAIFRIKNSNYLEDSEDFIYFFYIACGITEGIYLENLNRNISCNVENVHISNNKEESYIDIILEIQ